MNHPEHPLNRLRVVVERDLVYARPGGVPLGADLYLPAAAHPCPVIVWVHAGGWRFGTRRLAPDLSRCFAERGFAMAAIDYRLTSQAIFPAQVEDLRTAIRWLRSVASRYGFDGSRIALWGSSAGGHLSAIAALAEPALFEPAAAPYLEYPCDLQAVVAGYPPVDFLRMDEQRPPPGTRSSDPESLLLPRLDMRSADPDSFESLLVGGPIAGCADAVRRANPLSYARAGAPPFLILHGLADTTIAPAQSVLLYEGLAAHGNDVTLCLVAGLGHGFLHRTHLDDAPPRQMTIRRTLPGGGERTTCEVGPVFPMIEEFFRTRLGPAASPEAMDCRKPGRS